ncbi:histidine kinase [Leptospira kobayashii]|uniref:histidine kinase n=1 Tax=Leptospira kobayashii TaxID=1917830 RepID=A0ABN6KJS1_9LEPT|nr:ATP-binding protein [Leptospira kobayashii]BDA80372.1 histidine kinase [Leptospira kobayashii]
MYFRTLIKFILPLSLLLAFGSCSPVVTPSAELGVLDLSLWDFQESVDLKGDWEFYWQDFLEPTEEKPDRVRYVSSPKSWTSLEEFGNPLPSFGFATYRLTVILPEEKEDLVLSLPGIYTSYKLFLNGEFVHEGGVMGSNPESSSPSLKSALIPVKNINKILKIQIQVANFYDRNAGIHDLISIGRPASIYSRIMSERVLNWVISAILFFLSLYHILIYFARKTELASLCLAIVFLGVIYTRIGLAEQKILFDLFSDSWCLTFIRAGRVSFALIVAGCSGVIYYLFGTKNDKWALWTGLIYGFVASAVAIFLPIRTFWGINKYFSFFSLGLIFTAVIFVFRSVIQGKKNSIPFLFSLILPSVTITLEVLGTFNFINPIPYIGLYTLFFFFTPQTYILTRSFIQVFKREEEISRTLFRSNEDLEHKVKERTSELEKANRWKANFISLLSHDLRSPLVGVSQILDLMKHNIDSMEKVEKHRIVDLCKDGIQNSLRMIKQLLDVSRFDSDGIRLHPIVFSVKDLLEDIIKTLQPITSLKDVNIELNLTKDNFIIGDRILLEEVFKNIITNSIKFSFKGSKIEIFEKSYNGWISIEVVDHGMGMDADQIYQITAEGQPKSRAGTEGELGTGLGLKLSQTILEAHFGKLKIKSEIGKGSKFEILLSDTLKSILLVDDSDQFRNELAEELRRKKWIVIEAKNGEDALDHLTRITPNVIVTDKHMPIMDGISFVHEWEAVKEDRDIPIILISSDAPLSGGKKFLQEEGLEEIVPYYFSKLLRREELVETILSVLK